MFLFYRQQLGSVPYLLVVAPFGLRSLRSRGVTKARANIVPDHLFKKNAR